MSNADLLNIEFVLLSIKNEAETKKKGRPIYDDVEHCRITAAGNRKTIWYLPAHEAEPNATRLAGGEKVTYAMHYNKEYLAFKAGEAQVQSGTPLAEAPFLAQGRRLELKALNIHTVETLASLDGQPLRQLGLGGREMKNQAQAYLDAAAKTASATFSASRVAELERRIAELEAERSGATQLDAEEEPAGPLQPIEKTIEDCTDQELKAFIARETGSPVLGNPKRDTLLTKAHALAVNSQAKAA